MLNLPHEDREFMGFVENLSNGVSRESELPTLEDLRGGLPPYKQRIVDAIVPFNKRGVMPERREVEKKMDRGVRPLDFSELARDGYIGHPKISLLVRLYAQLRLVGRSVVIWFPSPLRKSLGIDRKGNIRGPGGKIIRVHKYFLRPDCQTVPRLYFVKAVDSDGVLLPEKVLPLYEKAEGFSFYNAYTRYNVPNHEPQFPIYLTRYRVL